MLYRGREGIEVIMDFVKGPLLVPFFILQFGIGSLLPLLVITFLIWRGTSGTDTGRRPSPRVPSLVLLAVLMMRYNVVIGGQEIAKTGKGLLAYRPPIFGREGLLAAAVVLVVPIVLLSIVVRFLPPWREEETTLASAGAR